MKKVIGVTLLLAFVCSTGFAQLIGGEFEKLGTLFLQGKYEDCVNKAIKITESDKTKKHPEPYLYVAMALYEVSESEKGLPEKELTKAFKESMKWAAKFKKKDKEDDYYTKNSAFITKLKKKALKIADALFDAKEYSDAQYYFKAIMNFSDDPNVRFLWGVCDFKIHSDGQARINVTLAVKDLNKAYSDGEYNEQGATSYELSKAMIIYSQDLEAAGKSDSAQATISLARKLLPGDTAVQEQFGKLIE